jgi:hypothetical protein
MPAARVAHFWDRFVRSYRADLSAIVLLRSPSRDRDCIYPTSNGCIPGSHRAFSIFATISVPILIIIAGACRLALTNGEPGVSAARADKGAFAR